MTWQSSGNRIFGGFFRRLKVHSPFFLGLLLSFAAVIVLLPEYFLRDEVFVLNNPGHLLAFNFVSDYLNGGIQLWNRFNEQPNVFLHFQYGYYSLHNFLLSILVSLFGEGSFLGSDFRITYVRSIVGLSLLFQTFGLYLLLRRFTRDKFLLVLGILYGNTLLSTGVYYISPTTSSVGGSSSVTCTSGEKVLAILISRFNAGNRS